jgi:hypothetical protein
MRQVSVLVLSMALITSACSRPPPQPPAQAPDAGGPGAKLDEDVWLKKEDLLAYLEGKSLPLRVPAEGKDPPPTVILTRKQVEAVEVEQRIDSGASHPWGSTPASLIVRVDDARYVIRLQVLHRLVEGKRVFKEFEVREVVKQ